MPEEVIIESKLKRLQPFQTVAEYAAMGIWHWNAFNSELLDVELVEGQFVLRRQFRRDFGYVLASAEVMKVLAELFQNLDPILDAGCGSGYLSKELTRLGVSTFAVDYCDFRESRPVGHGYPINTVYQLDALGDAASFITSRFGAVLLTWPPYDNPFALKVAKAMRPGQWLVYEGEDVGGCTADEAFFEFMNDSTLWEPLPDASARLDAVHVTLDTLHDHWAVWKRIS
jgi:SAM-dependent methyltransferase